MAVVGSIFSFPVFGSKCAPVQHMVNIICAVLLGPWYGLGVAFAASLLRNLLSLGTLLAFPGSMCGALLCGLVYWKTQKLLPTLVAEVFGTAVLGGLCAYPLAILFMGKNAGELAFFALRDTCRGKSWPFTPTSCPSWCPPPGAPSSPASSSAPWAKRGPSSRCSKNSTPNLIGGS